MIHENHFYDISFFVNSCDRTLLKSIVYNIIIFSNLLRYWEVNLLSEMKYIAHLIWWFLKIQISQKKKK